MKLFPSKSTIFLLLLGSLGSSVFSLPAHANEVRSFPDGFRPIHHQEDAIAIRKPKFVAPNRAYEQRDVVKNRGCYRQMDRCVENQDRNWGFRRYTN